MRVMPIAVSVMIMAIFVGLILMFHHAESTFQKNKATTQVIFDQSRSSIQEIPNDDVNVVYFRDSAADLCYALIMGASRIKSNGVYYSFGGISIVPCEKVMLFGIAGEQE